MTKKLKIIISAFLLALSAGVYITKSNTEELNLKTIEADIEVAIDEVLEEVSFIDSTAYVFVYYSNYERRVFLVNNQDLVNPDESVTEDPFFSEALLYHQANLCMLRNTTLIESSSLKKALTKRNMIDEDKWYISCPIYIANKLVGYVSVVRAVESNQVSPAVNKVQLLAYTVEQAILQYL